MTSALLPMLTERCVLRPFREADLPVFAAYRADPEVGRYQSWSAYTMDDARAFYEEMGRTRLGDVGTWYQVAIADRATDELLGDCALHFVDDAQVEIGFTLSRAHQGRGIMAEAVRALVTSVFRGMRKHRVFAVTDARNDSAARLLEKLGFRREAHFRKNVFFKGAWGDEFVFACLAEEWQSGAAP